MFSLIVVAFLSFATLVPSALKSLFHRVPAFTSPKYSYPLFTCHVLFSIETVFLLIPPLGLLHLLLFPLSTYFPRCCVVQSERLVLVLVLKR